MSTTTDYDEGTGAEQINWDLSDLYNAPDDPALQSDREQVVQEAERFAGTYRGRVAELTPDAFLQALKEYEAIVERVRKIGSYSHLAWSVDTADPALGKLVQEAGELGSEVNQKLVFFDVEWMQVDESKAQEMISDEQLRPYRHYLITSRLWRDHTLTEGQEQVMSAKNVTGRSAWNRFFDETMGAARYELDGESLTQQEVLSKLHSSDRELRERAQQSLTDTFRGLSRQMTFIFNTLLADKQISDRLRGHKSWIASRNLSNQIDQESVDALVQSVTDGYPLVQRTYRLKRELLELDTLYDYDRYAPVLESGERIRWLDGRRMVLDAFGGFHPEMERIASRFFEEQWIDAAIKPGKRGGAYSASTVSSVHPYVFMNYDGQLRDVQTLAHELGHGVHQYLAREQGELQANTPLTTAETASVFAEMLVFDKLMERLEDPAEKLSLLTSKIDDTVATVFRQISMNRFEDAIHTTRREKGELTTDQFSSLWMDTQRQLYGDSVHLTDNYQIWWCYIPHFLHTPGYVYAYAFGELLVLALYQAYRESRDGFADRYLAMLEAGGSDWPHELMSDLGMDIRDPGFWQKGLQIFEEMVNEAETLKQTLDSSGNSSE